MINLLAKDIMQRNVLAVKADWYLDQLTDFLIENFISGAPVISEDEKLIGVISLTDIVRYNSMPLRDNHRDTLHEYYLDSLEKKYSKREISSFRIEADKIVTVGDIMTNMVFDVKEDAKVQQIADYMIKGRIHRVFVTQKKKLLGIITSMDLLKILRDI